MIQKIKIILQEGDQEEDLNLLNQNNNQVFNKMYQNHKYKRFKAKKYNKLRQLIIVQ